MTLRHRGALQFFARGGERLSVGLLFFAAEASPPSSPDAPRHSSSSLRGRAHTAHLPRVSTGA